MVVDHIGYVVNNIEDAVERFTKQYGFSILHNVIYDPLQKVRLAMIISSDYRIELIEPVDEHSPSYDFMRKGGGFHHFCYAVADMEQAIKDLQAKDHLLFVKPVKAILFGGKKVAFLFSRKDKKVIELVEYKEQNGKEIS